MAEHVNEIPGRRRTIPRYPWEEWFDGSVWELVQGKDFACKTVSMHGIAKAAARVRGLRVNVARRGDRVYVQALR